MKIQNAPALCAGLRPARGVGYAAVKLRMANFGWAVCAAAILHGAETHVDGLNLREVLHSNWSVPKPGEAAGGGPLRVARQTFARGFGTAGGSRLEIALAGGAEKFRAQTGVDDTAGPLASVRFLVVGDGRVIYRGPWQQRGGPAVPVEVGLADVRRLALVTDVRGEPHAAADWLEPVIEHAGAVPMSVSPEATPLPAVELAKPAQPKFAATAVAGVRPGRPWLWRVGVTGVEPVRISVGNLPGGLTFDPATRVISGVAPTSAGEYRLRFVAENSHGRAEREFRLVVGETLALTPPMGWSSWYCMSGKVSDVWVREAAEALVKTGLADRGWTQVNLDDFWMTRPAPDDARLARLQAQERLGRMAGYYKAVLDDLELLGAPRDAAGRIRPNARFPDMPALTAQLHARGLRAGLYSSPGVLTCGGCTGSFGHEEDDAAQFAAWGFDFLKYDWCSYYLEGGRLERADWLRPYARMGAALRAQPRDLVFSLCQYGHAGVWEWGAETGGQLWRVGDDLVDTWGSVSAAGFFGEEHDRFIGPGHWNDLDFLMLGRIGWNRKTHPVRLTPDEQRTHFALWCLRASPLLLAGDPAALEPFTLSLLTNDAVIAVNQDPLGRPARRVVLGDTLEAWVRPLADGAVAVGVFNRDEETASATVTWAQLGLPGVWRVRDLWRDRELAHAAAQWSGAVARHGVELLRLEPFPP